LKQIVPLEKKSFQWNKNKIYAVGFNLTFETEKNVPLEQIIPLEQNGKNISLEPLGEQRKKK